jgi:hypothetical protein
VGGEAAFAQLLITWGLSRFPADLVLHASDRKDPQLDEFVGRLHGLTAALMCDEATARATAQSVRDVLLRRALQRLAILHGPNPGLGSRGQNVEVVCADHFRADAPTVFYRRGDDEHRQIRSEREFQAIATKLVAPAIPERLLRNFDPADITFLGSFLYEVFKNTDEHATSDEVGNKLRRSVRGVFIRHHMVTPEALRGRLQGLPRLADYSERIRPAHGEGSRYQFLEASVFDSGPGFASRLKGRPLTQMTVDEEFEAVVACFEKNVTTKREGRYGQGLPYILDLLRAHHGFLRLRTGRLSLCIDGSRNEQAEVGLRDVSDSDAPVARSPVHGALLTMVLPLSKR